MRSGASNSYTLRFDASNDRMLLAMNVDGSAYYIRTENVDSYMKPGTWHNVQAIWDLDQDFATIAIDGKIDEIETITEDFQGTVDVNLIGYNLVNLFDGIMDEVKFYSEAILPFGAFYTGYEQNGNYSGADPSLVFYWDAESETARVGENLAEQTVTLNAKASLTEEDKIYGNRSLKFSGTYSNTNFTLPDVDYSRGCIGAWVKNENIEDASEYYDLYFDSNNYVLLTGINSSPYLRVTYYGQSDATYYNSASAITSNTWNWLKVCWDNYDEIIWTEVNGVRNANVSLDAIWDTSVIPSVRVGNNSSDNPSGVYIDQVFITNDITDEIPTAFGRPLNIPIMKVNNTRQSLGYDYWASWTPDPSSVVLQYFKDINASSIIEVGASEGAAQVRRIRGGVRLEGGVRF